MPDQIAILLVDDNPTDVRLTQEAFIDGRVTNNLFVVSDGVEAMAFLHKEERYATAPRPELILLDWNLPRKTGYEVLVEIKSDPALTSIPVIILTTSEADEDIRAAYDAHANGYIVKPVDTEQFFATIRNIREFWMSIVALPPKPSRRKSASSKAEGDEPIRK